MRGRYPELLRQLGCDVYPYMLAPLARGPGAARRPGAAGRFNASAKSLTMYLPVGYGVLDVHRRALRAHRRLHRPPSRPVLLPAQRDRVGVPERSLHAARSRSGTLPRCARQAQRRRLAASFPRDRQPFSTAITRAALTLRMRSMVSMVASRSTIEGRVGTIMVSETRAAARAAVSLPAHLGGVSR